jgi:hypothetical protein
MDRKATVSVFAVCAALLAVTVALVAFLAPESNARFKDGATALVFITGAAVAIERGIEALWTMLGGTLGTFWPLNWVRKQVDALTDSLGKSITLVSTQLTATLTRTGEMTKSAEDRLPEVTKELQALKAQIDEVKQMAPDSQRLQLVAAAAANYINRMDTLYAKKSEELKQALETAKSTINGMQNVLSSFKDNPGRRLISIFLGAMLGLILAGVFGLDVFQAVLEGGKDSQKKWQIIFTGLMIGLGSNPTHEVIRAIQEYKKNRKGENTAMPDLP